MVIPYVQHDGSNATCPIDYKIRWPPVKQDERADQGCSSQLSGAILRQENQFWYSAAVLLEFSLVNSLLSYIFYGLEFVGYSFAYVARLVYLRDVWIRTQWAAVASRRATNLATYLPLFLIILLVPHPFFSILNLYVVLPTFLDL